MNKSFVPVAILFLSGQAVAQEAGTASRTTIENGGRSVAFTDEVLREHTGYDSPWHFSHAIRAGDFVYISGVIISAREDEDLPMSRERFRERTEEIFEYIQRSLGTADASLEEVVQVCRLFQWLIPGLITNVAYFRHQLEAV